MVATSVRSGPTRAVRTRDRVVKGRRGGRFRSAALGWPAWWRVPARRATSRWRMSRARRSGTCRGWGSRCAAPPTSTHIARHVIDDLGSFPASPASAWRSPRAAVAGCASSPPRRLSPEGLEWCHIDAYDDVPLTAVVRNGEPVLGDLDALEAKYPDLVACKRDEGIAAMAAWPLPGTGSPIGGIVLFYDAAAGLHRPAARPARGGRPPRRRGGTPGAGHRRPRPRRRHPGRPGAWPARGDARACCSRATPRSRAPRAASCATGWRPGRSTTTRSTPPSSASPSW